MDKADYGRFNLLIMALIIVVQSVHSFYCDPNNPSTCKYAGKCIDTRLLPQFFWGSGFNEDVEYVCKCPAVSCHRLMGFDPVCGDDGRTYLNRLCLVMQECSIQKEVKIKCHGFCEKHGSCIEVKEDERSQPCDATNEDFCLNNGICVVYPDVSNEPFCICTDEFVGRRCERRSLLPQIKTRGKQASAKLCGLHHRSYCRNGGSCFVQENSPNRPFCKCQQDYAGTRCETRIHREQVSEDF